MRRDQISLFDLPVITIPLEERVARATATIARIFEAGTPICVSFSGGKDSGTCADLVLCAARMLAKTTSHKPLVIVTTGDTLVENPEITAHYRKELKKMEAFGKQHGFRVITRIAKPALLSTWQLKVLSGRGLPSFAGQNTDCSYDLKISSQVSMRKSVFRELAQAGLPEAVTILGTRFDESEKRSLNMLLRGENDFSPVRNSDGDLILAPIAEWETDTVFEYLGTRTVGESSYSDFRDTLRIYAHAEGQSCAIVASVIQDGMAKRKKGGCGTRTGCWVCQQAEDKSLANMVAYDPMYEYAAGLNKLNVFIRNTRYDLTRRHWIGRTIKAGFIAIEPDTYSPAMVREIYRYMIQLQHDEAVRARRAGQHPKFTIFSDEMILALDAYWSLNGMARPFTAWADADDIRSDRVRYDIPEVDLVPRHDMPPAMFLHVGTQWDDSLPTSEISGLRDSYMESLLEISACGPSIKETRSGNLIWDLETESSFKVDSESTAMIMDFEMDRLLEQHRQGVGSALPGSITHGYKWYLMYGAIQLNAAQTAKHDEILRRTAFKDSLGLCLDYDLADVLKRSVRYCDLPDDARQAWSRKATTSSAQTDLIW
ncbi:conserved hypothetical protein (plasmid) [Rhodoferax ferrireducens T118]|uniref:Uncharacterized protein n=1 Tax=Albidiferax ferrireducens (strain ATCC BAA-621 / DSM 15236 / T118) TaxID=338969 RepID=Q21QC5_ALBFT|nr:phosphoadenosine phosphosulfate reductase family protein [Rhodoferax ferrireducens]ABD72020.1 conserved hypothetical protein [Rhodoferax ferrireducens T118]